MTLSAYLQQPFDYFTTSKNRWIYIISSTCFAVFFLLLFQPFGLSQEFVNPKNTILEIFLFFTSIVLTIFIGLFLSQFIIRPTFKMMDITVKQYCYWYCIEVFILLLVNIAAIFTFPDLGDDPIEEELNIIFQLEIYFKIFTVLLFPFVGTVVYVLIKRMNSEINQLATKLNALQKRYSSKPKANNSITLLDEKDQKEMVLPLKEILFFESSNQYVLVHYIKNGEVTKKIIRTRLKKVIDELAAFPIIRCHRSYGINLLNIQSFKKINQKMHLVINDQEDLKIPVSKSYMEEIQEYLNSQ